MARIGRPQKPHVAQDGTIVPGLYHCPDGRWLVKSTGQKFTEAEERLAIAKFRAMQPQPPEVTIPIETVTQDQLEIEGSPALAAAIDSTMEVDGRISFIQKIPEAKLWEWMREQLIVRPDVAARMTGIPQLASIASLPIPKPSISLADIIAAYTAKNPASDKAKREAIAVLSRLGKHANAKTLNDLTIETLTAWRDEIERTVESGSTKEAYYSRVKTIIGFGLKLGMDTSQINAALDRCKVLWTATAKSQVDPRPISREHFHTLLDAGNGSWRPWLLCGLNLCMHLDEVCELKWDELDLAKGTYASIRHKTAAKRIPRAATLWPETVNALKGVTRRGASPYVFTSTHGTRYNRNTRGNDFAELRTAAKLSDDVTFDSLRDGAYTAACQAGVDDRLARLLAGHKAAGLQDNYVLRNPAIVKPACDAVYKAYGPWRNNTK